MHIFHQTGTYPGQPASINIRVPDLRRESVTTAVGQQTLMRPATILTSKRSARGFSMIEAMVTVAIIMILTAAVVPMVQVAFRIYQLRSAVASVRGMIQATRYRAIADGIP